MKLVRFDGRGRLLDPGSGKEWTPGQTQELADWDADRLAADPHVPVTVTDLKRTSTPPRGGEPEARTGEGQPNIHETEGA